MIDDGYIARDEKMIWRDIAGEIVIVGQEDSTVRMLNETASYIWSLADGTMRIEDIVDAMCHRFNVTADEARADVEQFCSQLIEAKLATTHDLPQGS
jgi:hypothetical protein